MLPFQRRATAVLATAAGIALLLSACGGGPEDSGDSSTSGHLTVVKAIESNSLDPALVNASPYGDSSTGTAIFDLLFWIDESEEIHYRLAEDISSEDGRSWTLTLRSGVEFHDGTPFDAEAVKFSWERLVDPALGSPAAGVASQITSIDVIDDVTLGFELADVNFRFPYRIDAMGALNWIVSPTAVNADPQGFGLRPVGAGPFVFDSWTAGAPIELIKNEDYWEDGLPLLESVTVVSNSDSTVAADLVATGGAQLRTHGLREGTDLVEQNGGSVVVKEHPGGTLLTLNAARAPFDDLRARQALAFAIDRELYNQIAFAGDEVPTETFVPETSPYFDASLRQEQNAERAQELFDELAAEGRPVHFEYVQSPNSSALGMGEMLTAVLGGYENVSIEVTNADLAGIAGLYREGRFDAAISGAFGLDMDTAFAEAFRTGGFANFGQWSDPLVDEALVTGRTSSDPEAVHDAYIQLQQRLVEDVPSIVLVRSGAVVSLAAGVDGVVVTATGHPILTEATYAPR